MRVKSVVNSIQRNSFITWFLKTGYFQSAQYGTFHEEWVGSPYMEWVKIFCLCQQGRLRKPQSHLRASQWNESPASFVLLSCCQWDDRESPGQAHAYSSGIDESEMETEGDLLSLCDPEPCPSQVVSDAGPVLRYFPMETNAPRKKAEFSGVVYYCNQIWQVFCSCLLSLVSFIS